MGSEGNLEFVDPFGVDGDGEADVGERTEVNGVGGRAAAVAFGAELGLDEARSRGEVGEARDSRVARARAYAGWEFDTRSERKRKPTTGGAVT